MKWGLCQFVVGIPEMMQVTCLSYRKLAICASHDPTGADEEYAQRHVHLALKRRRWRELLGRAMALGARTSHL